MLGPISWLHENKFYTCKNGKLGTFQILFILAISTNYLSMHVYSNVVIKKPLAKTLLLKQIAAYIYVHK